MYAQCRNKATTECTGANSEWRCPEEWAHCTAKYQDCMSTHCCQDEGFSCLKRPTLMAAFCRPAAKEPCSHTRDTSLAW